jgi:hypothetical protein
MSDQEIVVCDSYLVHYGCGIPRRIGVKEGFALFFYTRVKNILMKKLKFQLDCIADLILSYTGIDENLYYHLQRELDYDFVMSWLEEKPSKHEEIFKKYKSVNMLMDKNRLTKS